MSEHRTGQTSFLRSSPARAAVTAVTVYVIPLLWSPGLRSAAPWLGALSAWMMLVSQPPVDPKAMWARSGRDRGSVLGIFASMIAAQLAAVIEYRQSGGLIPLTEITALWTGLVIVIIGFALRLWSINTLGRFFTAAVEVVKGQRVIRTGPYARVRHPSYTGALLIAIGMLLMLRSLAGFTLLIVLVLPAYAHRIRVEEEALMGELGDEYVRYRGEVPAVMPALFK